MKNFSFTPFTKTIFQKYHFKSPWDTGEENKQFFNKNNIFSKNKLNLKLDQLPGFNFNKNKIFYVFLFLIFFWLLSGIYEVKEGEEAVILRFGEFTRKAYPGLNYRLPKPIENLYIERVNMSRRIEIGYRSNENLVKDNSRDIGSESIMLTGDENIVKLNCDVMWHIKDLPKYMFSVLLPQEAIKAVAQSVLRDVIGCTPIVDVLSNQKQEIAGKIHSLIQTILDKYNIGIEVEQVQLLKVEPPDEVISSYRDVQTSKADKEREINQAQAYRNDLIPTARGKAAQMLQQAQGYKQEVLLTAQGNIKRFEAVFAAYMQNKQVTKNRLTLDAIKQVMTGTQKTIVSEGVVLPHIQLTND